jgi:hypothetical protein
LFPQFFKESQPLAVGTWLIAKSLMSHEDSAGLLAALGLRVRTASINVLLEI